MGRLCSTLFCLGFLAVPLNAAPPNLITLQDQIRTMIDEVDASVVAVIASHNPAHGDPDPKDPGKLGEYHAMVPAAFGPRAMQMIERNKLDLSDPRNAVDHQVGSGVVLDEKTGLILTNYHLIEGARKIFVRYSDGRSGAYANIHAADARSDLAVLHLIPSPSRGNQIPPGLKKVRFGDVRYHDGPDKARATIYRGLFVIAVGHPLAAGFVDGQPSASWGMISNIRRRLPSTLSEDQRTGLLTQYGALIQTDARLALGSSGGALFNLDGEIIGLCTSAAAITGSEASGGYAVPMDGIYRGIVDVLAQGKEVEYGFLGVSPNPSQRELRVPGLEIANVTDRSPAHLAGLRPGDSIFAINDRTVRDFDDLFLLVGGALAGNTIKITYSRNGNGAGIQHTFAKLSKFTHPHTVIASVRPKPVFGLRVEYTSMLAQQNGPGMRQLPMLEGVVVRDLEPLSPAALKFKQMNLGQGKVLITHVNGKAVRSPSEFYEEAGRAGARVTIELSVIGDPSQRKVTLALP